MYLSGESAAAAAAAKDDRHPLPPPAQRAEARVFQSLTVSAVRTLVSRHAVRAGMDRSRSNDLVLAVNEIASNSVNHGGGWGVLGIWREGDALVCEITDRGRGDWSLPALRDPAPDTEDGYGLWLADRLCERVDVRSGRGGTVVRLEVGL